MPKSPITREHVDTAGRVALKASAALIRCVGAAARLLGRTMRHLGGAIAVVPAPVRTLALVCLLVLAGIVGALTLHGGLALACIVVVVPVCSIVLGALGHRWYSGLSGAQAARTESPVAEANTSELQRSVEYVDRKLTFALNAFGAERHQHAMVALFQAKTAMELTLGTEQDADVFLALDDHNARPRIRAGVGSTTALRESNTLAAS